MKILSPNQIAKNVFDTTAEQLGHTDFTVSCHTAGCASTTLAKALWPGSGSSPDGRTTYWVLAVGKNTYTAVDLIDAVEAALKVAA